MSTFQSLIERGVRADQPIASVVPVGTLYYVTDEGLLERSSGSAWESYSASSSGGLTLIQQIVTAASQATVDFTSIPATYKALILDFFSRDTNAGSASSVMRARINNDSTSGNYTDSVLSGTQNGFVLSATLAATAAGVFVMGNPQNGNTAGITNTSRLRIVGYAGTVFHKRLQVDGNYEDASTNLTILSVGARWKSTSAINRITFLTDGTAFLNGSTFNLYGQS